MISVAPTVLVLSFLDQKASIRNVCVVKVRGRP